MLIIDASQLTRVMPCNGSLLMQADPALAERDTTIREEGNAAHWLASVVFNGQQTALEMVDRKAPNGVFITAEMAEHVSEYVNAVGSLGGDVEWSYSISGNGWIVNGRADHARWECHPNDQYEQPYWVRINDFKYGFTPIEPENNWTLISHAIGYCQKQHLIPQFVTFVIQQPRAQHHLGRVREWTIFYADLLKHYEYMNAILSNPSNVLQTGQHCYHCPSFLSCPARQAAELNGIETSHIAYNAQIDNIDLSERLQQIKRAKELLTQSEKAYEELAIHRIKAGQVVKDFALENGLTNRMWKENMTPDLMRALTGKNIAKQVLPTPKQAELAGIPASIIGMFAERKSTGTKLIRSDANKKARKMFGDKK